MMKETDLLEQVAKDFANAWPWIKWAKTMSVDDMDHRAAVFSRLNAALKAMGHIPLTTDRSILDRVGDTLEVAISRKDPGHEGWSTSKGALEHLVVELLRNHQQGGQWLLINHLSLNGKDLTEAFHQPYAHDGLLDQFGHIQCQRPPCIQRRKAKEREDLVKEIAYKQELLAKL